MQMEGQRNLRGTGKLYIDKSQAPQAAEGIQTLATAEAGWGYTAGHSPMMGYFTTVHMSGIWVRSLSRQVASKATGSAGTKQPLGQGR